MLQWNTYRLHIYTNRNNEKVRTDFGYIFHGLRNDAEIERERKNEFDKKRQEKTKRENDRAQENTKRNTEDEESNDEDSTEERENRYIDELKSDENETDEKQRLNNDNNSVDLEGVPRGGDDSMVGNGVLVKKKTRKRNTKRRK